MGAHKASAANPHGVTKTQVGLGNVDNTSDANKPVSTAQQTALNTKANKAQEAWITPTLLNGWIGNQPVRYLKDEFGFVHLKGVLNAGVVGSVIFTLPAGYRPLNNYNLFSVSSGTSVGILSIRPFGDVFMQRGNTNEFALDGVTFKAEQ